ncbi:flagellar basal-body rod protein FlgF [Albimonas donghaensis]|uniref:Flagellar basal-body rod protein FlgF n=1 Tax=Albimonas donghaensis TaxID=356660 RepID=A0A1H2X2S3_9RHOB|nr:flagellar hook-basal body complex protein [Albimonas donghaensis]MAS44386.1 flagellar basal-body rod protein FlgF [Paracoccaceae bacterium]MBR28326.1 flagellar basal-body rod protein FlgF [Paracoccaceae bacterium]SDW87087.1 flagellar basal-body rod protein FlgF [Albimonas donghaensis]
MDNPIYLALSRQNGLLKEMQAVANNIANMNTSGYRREGVVFAEMIEAMPVEGGSISMTEARVRRTDFSPGSLRQTGGVFDLAIQGEGFFQVQTPNGPRLTRNGAFFRDAAGALVTGDGYPALDAGGAPVFAPPGGGPVVIGRDGAITVDGQQIGALGLVTVDDPRFLTREAGTMFSTDQPLQPADGEIFQGFIEDANVNPVEELTRMIEVQRAYELGQKLLEREDERIRGAVRQLGASS